MWIFYSCNCNCKSRYYTTDTTQPYTSPLIYCAALCAACAASLTAAANNQGAGLNCDLVVPLPAINNACGRPAQSRLPIRQHGRCAAQNCTGLHCVVPLCDGATVDTAQPDQACGVARLGDGWASGAAQTTPCKRGSAGGVGARGRFSRVRVTPGGGWKICAQQSSALHCVTTRQAGVVLAMHRSIYGCKQGSHWVQGREESLPSTRSGKHELHSV